MPKLYYFTEMKKKIFTSVETPNVALYYSNTFDEIR